MEVEKNTKNAVDAKKMTQIVTGFHAIEEKVRRALDSGKADGISIQLAKSGPRIKNLRKRKKSRNFSYKC